MGCRGIFEGRRDEKHRRGGRDMSKPTYRSLISICEHPRFGKIESCGMHDVTREFCLREAQNMNFLNDLRGKSDQNSCTQSMQCSCRTQARISIHNEEEYDRCHNSEAYSFICFGRFRCRVTEFPFKLVRVLHLALRNCINFPSEMLHLIHLRYLSLSLRSSSEKHQHIPPIIIDIPPSISCLFYLQTFILNLSGVGLQYPIMLPLESLTMPQLRHLRLDWNYLLSHEPTEKSLVLKNLQCFSGLNPRCVPLLLLPPSDAFPQNPKSLALSGQFFLPWKDLSIVGKLPKLESLKLSYNACEGVEWEVADEDISYCQESVVNSARQIQQDIQDSYGCSVEVHTRPVPPADCLLSPIGLPLRPGQPLCMYYCRYGICKFGSSCKFDHPMRLSLPESRNMPSGDNNIDIYPPITSQNHYFACTNSFEDAFQLVDLLKKGDLNSSNMASNSFLGTGPLMFTGENYHIRIIKMKAYLKALSLWEAVESENDPPPLGPNTTIAQMKNYEDAKSKKPKALTYLHSALSDVIFTRIMSCETPKEVWEKLNEEFDGSERVKYIKLLTLKREFEMFESNISAIEESCDLKTLSVTELISKLQAQEQRTSIRDEEVEEMAFQAKHKHKQPVKDNRRMEGDKAAKKKPWTESSQKGKFPPCLHRKRTNHQEKDCWFKGKP
ncbi:hypothetical protein FXO38_15911 [Capsicum annuum]|nr:hypothetical protein FXO38_15911 [Capsicum annuum]